RQRHLVDKGRVVRNDDVAARVRILPDARNNVADLVDRRAILAWPCAPLPTVHGTKVAVLVSPFVPDADAIVLQVLDVRIAAEEPQQLVDDRAQVQLLRRDERKAFGEVEAHLVAEHAQRAGAGAIFLARAFREDAAHQVEVLLHAKGLLYAST